MKTSLLILLALFLCACGRKSATIATMPPTPPPTPVQPEWAVPKDFSEGKFEGVRIGYEQAVNGQSNPSPLDLPFFMSAQWTIYEPKGDELSWKSGFVQGMREGFEEGERVRVEKAQLFDQIAREQSPENSTPAPER